MLVKVQALLNICLLKATQLNGYLPLQALKIAIESHRGLSLKWNLALLVEDIIKRTIIIIKIKKNFPSLPHDLSLASCHWVEWESCIQRYKVNLSKFVPCFHYMGEKITVVDTNYRTLFKRCSPSPPLRPAFYTGLWRKLLSSFKKYYFKRNSAFSKKKNQLLQLIQVIFNTIVST